MQMLSKMLIEEKGLYIIIEKSLDWVRRAGKYQSIASKDVNPIEWFAYTSLQKINMNLFNEWNKYIDLADKSIKEFQKVDDVSDLIKAMKSEANLENFKQIPEKLFFDTYSKFGLESKQMKAIQKLYKD